MYCLNIKLATNKQLHRLKRNAAKHSAPYGATCSFPPLFADYSRNGFISNRTEMDK